MRDGRVFSSTANRNDRRQVSLCDHSVPGQRCWGQGVRHNRYGTKADGRDNGKLVAIDFTCEGHAGLGGLYRGYQVVESEESQYWDEGFIFGLAPSQDQRS